MLPANDTTALLALVLCAVTVPTDCEVTCPDWVDTPDVTVPVVVPVELDVPLEVELLLEQPPDIPEPDPPVCPVDVAALVDWTLPPRPPPRWA